MRRSRLTSEPPHPHPASAFGGHDSIRRNTVFSFLVQVTTSVFTAALTLFLVRSLDVESYGTFTLALALASLIAMPADLGISGSAARFVAERRGDEHVVARILASSLLLKLLTSTIITVALVAAASPIASAYDTPELAWPIRGMALALLGQTLLGFVAHAFIGQGKVAATLRLTFSESAVEVGASVGLVLLGGGASGAAFGRAAGYLAGAALAIVMLAKVFGRSAVAVRSVNPGTLRGIARYAGGIALIDLVWALFGNLDLLLVGAFLGTAAVGVYGAPMRMIALLYYPGQAISNAVGPRLARHHREGPNVSAFETALRVIVVVQAALVAPLIVWSGPIADLLLGSSYAESGLVLQVVAPYVFLAGIAILVSNSIDYLGGVWRRIPLGAAVVALNVVLGVILIPRMGVVGAAIGRDAGMLLYAVGNLLIYRSAVGLQLRPLLATAVRSLVAAGAMAGVLAAVGTGELKLPLMLLGGLAGLVTFALTLLVTGELRLLRMRLAA